MNGDRFMGVLSGRGILSFRRRVGILAIGLTLGIGPAIRAWQEARVEQLQRETIPAADFSRLIREFSEEDGFFRSDNFISNETSYLHVLDKLRQLGASGGAYIGVGPEQNFTYISKIRPRIAFIVDIRRQAMIQHLMFKALFHLSEDRAQFLARWFSRPLAGPDAPGRGSSLDGLLTYFSQAPATDEAFAANLASIRKTIEEDFLFPLLPRDQSSLEYVYRAFRQENLNIMFRLGRGNFGVTSWAFWGGFPTLRDLLLETDLRGQRGSFLASEEDYEFLRDLHERNRIIPVVGDFAGTKALEAVAGYLRRNGYAVTAFYTSNVEEYLFSNGVFGAFAENVRKLPINDRSLFIRAFRNMWEPHPARIPGHRMTTLLQRMAVFLQDHDQGLYPSYWDLVTTHFIVGDEP